MVANLAADLIFRLLVSEFKTSFSQMDEEQTPVPRSSFPSRDLSHAAELLLRSSLSKPTTSAYKSVIQSYEQFVQFYCSNEIPFPPSLQRLLAFIAHSYLKGSAAYTVRTLISALSFIFQLGNFIIKKFTRVPKK